MKNHDNKTNADMWQDCVNGMGGGGGGGVKRDTFPPIEQSSSPLPFSSSTLAYQHEISIALDSFTTFIDKYMYAI